MTIKPIKIFSASYIDESTQIVADITDNYGALFDGDDNTLYTGTSNTSIVLSFTEAVKTDTLIIKNTNAESITVKYKSTSDGAFILLGSFNLNGKKDIFLNFALATATAIEISFNCEGSNFTVGQIIACKALLDLSDVLSSFIPSQYCRQGHYYLCSGQLIKWVEFCKKSGTLKLMNVNRTTRDCLMEILTKNNFLTYVFYGEYDLGSAAQYALSEPPVSTLDRVSALYQIDLSLIQR